MSGSLVRLGFSSVARETIAKSVTRNLSTTLIRGKKFEVEDESEKPYSYLKSPAAQWKATESRVPYENKPAWQSLMITVSMTVFMVYFFILREENDIDDIFTRDLRSYFPDMSDEDYKKAVGGSSSLGPPKI